MTSENWRREKNKVMDCHPPKRLLALLVLLAIGTGLTSLPAAAAPPAKVALTGARIVPVSGPEIPKGTLVMENGRITAVGAAVEIPYDAIEVDCSGQVLFPGMINPDDWRGLDRQNETLPVTPYVDVYDAIDPSRTFFEDSLRDGVTTIQIMPANDLVIGGLSRLVRPIGRTPDEMTVRVSSVLKLSTSPKRGFDRMLQLGMLRETFAELDDYLERLAEQKYEESVKEKEEKIDVGPAEAKKRGRELIRDADLDDKHRNLVRLRDGRLGAWIYCGAAMDVAPALSLAREQGFLDRTVLILGEGAVKAVAELKAAGRPVVLPPNLVLEERDPFTGAIEETFIPRVIHEAGLLFALRPSADSSLAERYLNYQAARLVRHGIPRADALASITMNPATLIGMGDQLGSLEVGKIANVVVFSGDPLDFNSWVEKVFIDGILAYDRDRDPRLKTLLGEEEGNDEGERPEEIDLEPQGNDDPKSGAAGESPAPATKTGAGAKKKEGS